MAGGERRARVAGGGDLGVARAWRHGPSYRCLRARRRQRERLGTAALASLLRHARVTAAGAADGARCAGRGQAASSCRCRSVRSWEQAGRARRGPDVTNGRDRLEAKEGRGERGSQNCADPTRRCSGRGCAPREGSGQLASRETSPAGAFGRGLREALGLRGRSTSVGSPGRGSGAGSATEALPTGVCRSEGRRWGGGLRNSNRQKPARTGKRRRTDVLGVARAP